jgi:hypothetical protein
VSFQAKIQSRDISRLIFASDKLVLEKKKRPRHPIIVDGGGVVTILAGYFYERAIFQNASTGTLEGEAYVLREYWEWLLQRRIPWDDVDDWVLLDWVRHQEKNASAVRIARKLAILFNFYFIAQKRLGALTEPIMEDPEAGVVSSASKRYPISVEVRFRKHGRGGGKVTYRSRFKYSTLPKRQVGRPTPSDAEVERIRERLLESEDDYLAARNWIAVGLMRECGLRGMGAAGLTIHRLADALAVVGIRPREGRRFELDELVGEIYADVRFQIRDEIRSNVRRGAAFLHVEVTEKFKKTRLAPFPGEFFIQNLDFIWNQRNAFIQSIRARRPTYRPAGLLISKKSRDSLLRKALSNLVNRAFKITEARGSSHRLRAAFAQERVRELYFRARAHDGRAWDAKTVLLQLSQEMGINNPEDLRPYLNQVMVEEELFRGEPVLLIGAEPASVFRALAKAVNDGNAGLLEKLHELLSAFALFPKKEEESFDEIRKRARRRASESNAV